MLTVFSSRDETIVLTTPCTCILFRQVRHIKDVSSSQHVIKRIACWADSLYQSHSTSVGYETTP